MTKEELVNLIIEDIKADEFDNKRYLYELAREALMGRTQEDLQQIVDDSINLDE